MNKIFKVVWSKTKECYVVVSEVAKNNGGKKKALSTVFAALVAVGAMMPGQAGAVSFNGGNSGGHADGDASIAIGSGWADSAYAHTQFSIAIGDHANATGKAAIALGRQSKTNGEEASIAIGNETEAIAKDSTAVGSGSKSSGEYAAALGFQTKATANYATAIGSGARGYAEDSQAIGREAETSAGAYRAIAIGTLSKSSGNYATSLGSSAEASAERAIAVGYKATAKAQSAISVGNLANADHTDSIAVGNGSAATGDQAIATGSNATATKIGSIAMGKNVAASGDYSTAIGNKAKASGANSIAFGSSIDNTTTGTVASGDNSIAIGMKSTASGDGAVAHGVGSESTGTHSVAVGRLSKAKGAESLALGDEAEATVNKSVAVGYKATASTADGVAIGSTSVASTAAGVQGFNPADSRTNEYGGLTSAAQTSTLAAVSIGNGSAQTRQITGLAAGKEDTDAVNVAQLRSVNLKYAADTGNSDFLLTDGTLTVKGDNDLISTSVVATGADKGAVQITAKVGGTINNTDGKAVKPTTNGIATTDNVADAINNSYWKATAGGNTDGTPSVGNVKPGTQVTYSAGDNLKVKQTIAANGNQEYKYSLNPVLTGITSIANTTTGPKMTFGGNSINITGGSLDMGTNKITNLAPGTADNDAVNVKQLKDTELHITPGTYTPDANKKVKLTYTDGNNTVVTGKEAVIDLSGLATGGTASTEKVKKAANGANDTNIAEVNPQTGDTYGAAGATYEVSVSRNAVKDAAREAVTVNNGGTTTGGTYTADTNNPISVTAVPDNTNHNTTYAVTFDGNKAAKQIPLTYKATNGTITTADQTVKLDKGLNFTGGDYTTASVGADGKVTFDVTLGTAPTVTDGKPGVPGQAGAAGKDGIATVKTVVDTINNSGWKANAKANGGTLVGNSTATVVKPGDQVNFAAGKNLTVKQDLTGEHTYTYSLNKDVDLTNAGSLTVGDTKVNNDGITIKAPTPAAGTTPTTDVKLTNTGLDNGGNKIVNVAEGTADTDAVNVKQLKDAKTVLADGKNTKKSGTGTAADPYKVNVEGDLTGISSITNGGTNNGKISFGPNKTVTVDGDHSITLNASTGKIGGLQNLTFDPTNFTSGQAATEDQLKSVHDTLKASELHIAPTESNRTGEHIAGAATSNTAAGAAANAYKYDATTKQVVLEYNDGTGANKTGTKAVIDFSALNTGGTTASTWTAKTSAENTTAGSEVGKHAGDTSQVIGNQNSVDFQAGKNMTVKQTNDGNGNTTINYALDKNLDVESVHVGKDGKDGKIGIDGKDGVDGLDGTNRVDIHVEKGAKGVDGTDGHDGVNGHDGKDGMTRIVYEDKGGKQEVATLNDGMKYAGDDAQGTDKTKVIAKKLNETLDIIGGANKTDLTTDNIGVNNDGNGKLLVQLSKNLKGINTIKNGNTTITLNDTPSTTTPAVTITGGNLSLGDGTTNNKIVNVAPGTDDTDAVNVKQLKDAKTVLADGKNTKKSGTGTAADPYKVNVEGDLTEITSITNKADASGNNAGKITFSPNQTVTVSGDHNISLNGKTGDITGLTNTTIPTTAGSDFATKGRAATEEQLKIVNDKFNNKINLGADGSTETTKLALDNNGGIKFNIKGDGSGASGANQYISTTASGSDIKVDLTQAAKDKLNKTYDVTSTDSSVQVKSTTTNGVTTFDLKVAPAAGTTSTWDIKSSADTANGGATATGHETAAKTIANAKTVEMIAGKNLTVKQTSDTNGAKVEFALSDEIAVGKDGTNGVDGKIGVNGKDGASVVINGKDGSIGLTGAPGTPGTPGASATLKVKDGVPGVDGAPGTNLTRIVYTDKNNVEHEVATHDDGMKFAGDDGQANQATNANVIKKHLNNVVDIIGGATKTDLTTNNIGVNNDGNGKLLVQLSKNLKGINTVKNGNTTITLNDASKSW
ncbi:MAG: ESPR-type extended signal peptide-containing protein [Veillonella sp.]|nr:ESPR-type extended signal peptide-containing protein [Veillonella sp.]